MRRLLSLLSVAFVATAAPATAQVQKIPTGDWYIQLPSKAHKDLPNLTAESDFVEGNTLGRISIVCDRTKYYLLLISPMFERKKVEEGSVSIGPGPDDRYAATFRDLYGTRNPLSAKLNWDADILFADIPPAMLTGFADGGTLRVDLRGQSWSVELKNISAKVRSFTAFCETGRRLDDHHFRD